MRKTLRAFTRFFFCWGVLFASFALIPRVHVHAASISYLPSSSQASTSTGNFNSLVRLPVLASDYANFLNDVAASDPHFFYDPKMGTDSETPSIKRLGTPGNFHYEVIAGREKELIVFVGEIGKTAYCEWKQERLQDAKALKTKEYGLENDPFLKTDKIQFSFILPSPTLNMIEMPTSATSALGWDGILEEALLLALGVNLPDAEKIEEDEIEPPVIRDEVAEVSQQREELRTSHEEIPNQSSPDSIATALDIPTGTHCHDYWKAKSNADQLAFKAAEKRATYGKRKAENTAEDSSALAEVEQKEAEARLARNIWFRMVLKTDRDRLDAKKEANAFDEKADKAFKEASNSQADERMRQRQQIAANQADEANIKYCGMISSNSHFQSMDKEEWMQLDDYLLQYCERNKIWRDNLSRWILRAEADRFSRDTKSASSSKRKLESEKNRKEGYWNTLLAIMTKEESSLAGASATEQLWSKAADETKFIKKRSELDALQSDIKAVQRQLEAALSESSEQDSAEEIKAFSQRLASKISSTNLIQQEWGFVTELSLIDQAAKATDIFEAADQCLQKQKINIAHLEAEERWIEALDLQGIVGIAEAKGMATSVEQLKKYLVEADRAVNGVQKTLFRHYSLKVESRSSEEDSATPKLNRETLFHWNQGSRSECFQKAERISCSLKKAQNDDVLAEHQEQKKSENPEDQAREQYREGIINETLQGIREIVIQSANSQLLLDFLKKKVNESPSRIASARLTYETAKLHYDVLETARKSAANQVAKAIEKGEEALAKAVSKEFDKGIDNAKEAASKGANLLERTAVGAFTGTAIGGPTGTVGGALIGALAPEITRAASALKDCTHQKINQVTNYFNERSQEKVETLYQKIKQATADAKRNVYREVAIAEMQNTALRVATIEQDRLASVKRRFIDKIYEKDHYFKCEVEQIARSYFELPQGWNRLDPFVRKAYNKAIRAANQALHQKATDLAAEKERLERVWLSLPLENKKAEIRHQVLTNLLRDDSNFEEADHCWKDVQKAQLAVEKASKKSSDELIPGRLKKLPPNIDSLKKQLKKEQRSAEEAEQKLRSKDILKRNGDADTANVSSRNFHPWIFYHFSDGPINWHQRITSCMSVQDAIEMTRYAWKKRMAQSQEWLRLAQKSQAPEEICERYREFADHDNSVWNKFLNPDSQLSTSGETTSESKEEFQTE